MARAIPNRNRRGFLRAGEKRGRQLARHVRWRLVLELFVLWCCFASTGIAKGELASANWRTIETAHFRVHFPARFEAWAGRAAGALEGIHDRVVDFVGYTPLRKIDVVVSDPEADANGIAYPFLDRPRIELWASPPDPESGLGDFRDWTELLVTHEFTHIVHLTRPRNKPGVLERFLPIPVGPVLFRSPRWVAEGYATVVEGALTGSGRPSSSYRAMVLRRFAIEGKLPSYARLDATSGWLGGSMAYLVGSSYLEWLEAREGTGSLRRLWKRMASRRGGTFPGAFRAVFGRSPADLYDRFRAEMTARALGQEKGIETAGIVAGDTWQRLEGGTASLEVSPDGKRLLARRSPRRGEAFLAIWTISPTESEASASAKRNGRDLALTSDPNEIADKPADPLPRSPRWTLPRSNGRAPEDPRWMPDGERVVFTRREPSRDGVLHRDLFLWTPRSGSVVRLTRGADVSDASPFPDGRSAIAVRNRYGMSELVRVDLATGAVSPFAVAETTAVDPWDVWSHPRVSPDGGRVAALRHREGKWELTLLPVTPASSATGLAYPVGGSPYPRRLGAGVAVFGAPAWSADGSRIEAATDASGVWELAEFRLDGAAPRMRTRLTGGAYSPAPENAGSGLFYLSLTAKGVDIARLPPDSPAPGADAERLPAILPPPAAEASPLSLSPVPLARPYRAFSTEIVRAFSAFSAGPDGGSWQAGVEGSDVVGRLDWIAAAAVGNAAGPRGGIGAITWSGLPVSLSAQIFSALERPGAQRLVARPELDQDRRGVAIEVLGRTVMPWGRLRGEVYGGATRVEPLERSVGAASADPRDSFRRSLVGAHAAADWRRDRGKNGIALALDLGGQAGRTDGSGWSGETAAARAEVRLAGASLAVTGRACREGGSPTAFDLFAVGGAASAVLPAALDANRIDSPALPAAAQMGKRFEGLRAEVSSAGFPVLFYAERWRAWTAEKPAPIRLEGIELRLERLVPLDLPESLSFYVGAARVRSTTPRFDSVRGYAGLIYRP